MKKLALSNGETSTCRSNGPALDQKRVDEIPLSILANSLRTPILLTAHCVRFVLVEGLHLLEAARALCEKTIVGFLGDVQKH